jgi:hypothetical protein
MSCVNGTIFFVFAFKVLVSIIEIYDTTNMRMNGVFHTVALRFVTSRSESMNFYSKCKITFENQVLNVKSDMPFC